MRKLHVRHHSLVSRFDRAARPTEPQLRSEGEKSHLPQLWGPMHSQRGALRAARFCGRSIARTTQELEIIETVPLQPQVPSSKEGSVNVITSITSHASKLSLLRDRRVWSLRSIYLWGIIKTVIVNFRRHEDGHLASQHRSCRYPSAVSWMEHGTSMEQHPSSTIIT